MFSVSLRSQLQAYLRNIRRPVELIVSQRGNQRSHELLTMLNEIASLTDLVTVIEEQQGDERKPSFSIRQAGAKAGIQFAATPTGPEFSSLVLAILQVGGHPVIADSATIEQIRTLERDYYFETYISLSCRSCVDVVQALNMMTVINPRIHNITIDGGIFQSEVSARDISVVPTIYMNGEIFGEGRSSFEELGAKLLDIETSMKAALRAAGKP
ncbi:alkyl hydroperoxide reductase [Paraburkholderia sp. MMS20-SJTN17]|uniref:Alkyl hydroperoxide reductase n=1 Tax=Paraburkholderia translucens TaxID=2886945 RepID=A0ABS8KCJ6_9BURK|nr:alkyl hydroperoxide reductase [Paraburkholderia sp. MMS20-SJTN17]MCC8402491.1 alkyl hydroperoxide reductase [Paraburkholderia sp. MMS20-SJTN17]